MLRDCSREFAGFVDDCARGDEIVGDFDSLTAGRLHDQCEIALAIGYRHLDARLACLSRLMAAGFRLATLVHPAAYVARGAALGEGTLVMARASIDTSAVTGEAVVLWPGANVSHDSKVARNSFISPSAVLCGFVEIGESSFVGAGAIVTDRVQVPAGSFITAGTRYSGGPLPRWRPAAALSEGQA
jgi:UDP-3-O-[3-hydroxymyristoyl] glucosamine N-acyltransferase